MIPVVIGKTDGLCVGFLGIASAAMSTEPTQSTSGATAETSDFDTLPMGMNSHLATFVSNDKQISALVEFLQGTFPAEVALSNRQVPETPVATAIRLLTGFQATVTSAAMQRCPAEYCNRTPHSIDEPHEWIVGG